MKKRKLKTAANQQGFIPMMLGIVVCIAFVVYLVYTRVAHMAQ